MPAQWICALGAEGADARAPRANRASRPFAYICNTAVIESWLQASDVRSRRRDCACSEIQTLRMVRRPPVPYLGATPRSVSCLARQGAAGDAQGSWMRMGSAGRCRLLVGAEFAGADGLAVLSQVGRVYCRGHGVSTPPATRTGYRRRTVGATVHVCALHIEMWSGHVSVLGR